MSGGGRGAEAAGGRSPARRRLDSFLAGLCRLVLSVFFRRVEVEGRDRVPLDRPLVVVANHGNSLVDPVLLLGYLPVTPRFLGKSTLWKIPLLRPLLALAAVIPVYRRKDPGVDPARNRETFARCRAELAAGGVVALFPEGASHSEPALLPLKTGAARIVLGAEAEHAERCGERLGLRVLPVGLVFDVRGRFRSRALVRVGEPLDPLAAAGVGNGGTFDPDEAEAVRALTAAVEQALGEVTVNYDSWEEARLIGRAAEIWDNPSPEMPRHQALADGLDARRAFLLGYRELSRHHPERLRRAAGEVAAYESLLRAAGLRDRQVAARYPLPGVARWLARTLGVLVAWLPLAALGTLLNLVPYLAVRLIARTLGQPQDQRATYKIFPALAVYPLTWVAEALAAARLWPQHPVLAAGTALLAGPLAGWAALLFHDHRRRLLAEGRAYLVLRTRRRLTEALRRRREAVRREVTELVELYAGGGAAAPADGSPSRAGPGGSSGAGG